MKRSLHMFEVVLPIDHDQSLAREIIANGIVEKFPDAKVLGPAEMKEDTIMNFLIVSQKFTSESFDGAVDYVLQIIDGRLEDLQEMMTNEDSIEFVGNLRELIKLDFYDEE